jgi:hypothetical protein
LTSIVRRLIQFLEIKGMTHKKKWIAHKTLKSKKVVEWHTNFSEWHTK